MRIILKRNLLSGSARQCAALYTQSKVPFVVQNRRHDEPNVHFRRSSDHNAQGTVRQPLSAEPSTQLDLTTRRLCLPHGHTSGLEWRTLQPSALAATALAFNNANGRCAEQLSPCKWVPRGQVFGSQMCRTHSTAPQQKQAAEPENASNGVRTPIPPV